MSLGPLQFESHNEDLAAERVVARAYWNLILSLSPPFATLVCLPLIIQRLGISAYGVLQVALAIAGVLLVCDLNLGVALTRQVADRGGKRDAKLLRGCVRTGLSAFTISGVCASVTVILTAPWLAGRFMHADGIPSDWTITCLRLAGVALLPTFACTYGTSVLNGMHRFIFSTAVNSSNLIITMTGWTLMTAAGVDIRGLMVWNAAVSFAAAGVLLVALARRLPRGVFGFGFHRGEFGQLIGFATFSLMGRVGSLITSTADRLIVAASLGSAAVSLYAVPTALSRYLLSGVTTMSTVLFPLAAHQHAREGVESLGAVYVRSARVFATFAVGLPLVVAATAEPLLSAWLGTEFARSAWPVLTFASLLACASILTTAASHVVEGIGRPDLSGTMRLIQNLAGLLLAFFLTPRWGISGTAISFLLPALVTVPVFLWIVERRVLRLPAGESFRLVYLRPLLVGVLVIGGSSVAASFFSPIGILGVLSLLVTTVFWYVGLVGIFRPVPLLDLRLLLRSGRFMFGSRRAADVAPLRS